MSATRLSLSMDYKVLERARRLSKARNVSISRMFVAMIYQMDAEDRGRQSLPPVTSQLRGLLKPGSPLPKDWDYRDLLGSGKMERFGAQ